MLRLSAVRVARVSIRTIRFQRRLDGTDQYKKKSIASFTFHVMVVSITCLSAVSVAQAQTVRADRLPPDSMEERVAACVGCHGVKGEGTDNVYFPRLSGKPSGYLYNQLVAFRNGTRKYTPMNYLLEYLPDPYLKKMAQYFSDQNPAVLPAENLPVQASVLSRGESVIKQGIPALRVPACISCHGTNLNGREPGIPGLLGLRADYIVAQLSAWRYGTRTARAPDCMQSIASALSETDVTAVSAWLASRPRDSVQRPLAISRSALPLTCGSQQ